MLKDPNNARNIFRTLDNNRHVSILGLNDDIVSGYDEIVGIMKTWFESRWPDKAPWERK